MQKTETYKYELKENAFYKKGLCVTSNLKYIKEYIAVHILIFRMASS